MAVNLSPIGNDAPFVDSNGDPLSGGKLYTYTAGSSTPQNTYTTSTGNVANANPIVLGSTGYPTSGGNVVAIWLTAGVSYKFVLENAAGTVLWTRDNISGINDTTVTIDEWVIGPAPTYISATSFTLAGDQTSTFNVGRRLKTTNSGGTIYSTILSSSYGALTTITVVNDSGTLDSGLSAVSYGLLSKSNDSMPRGIFQLLPYDGAPRMVNGKISATVAANALTLAVKDNSGNDPSLGSPVYALFPKASLTDAGFDVIAITAALSVVVSSGSTLGHASAIAQHVFVYLVNNAGAAEVAVSNLPPDYPGTFGKARLVSTTAEGGAGAADSATGVYSTTARSNVPWICVAKILTTQTTAGTWAAAITQIDQAPFVIPSNIFSAYRSSAQTFAHATTAKVSYSTELYDPDGVYDAVTNYRFQPNVAGYYEVQMKVLWGSLAGVVGSIGYIYKNGSEFNRVQYNQTGTISNHCVVQRILMNGTSDYLEGYTYQASGGNSDLGAGGSYNTFDGGRCAQQGAS